MKRHRSVSLCVLSTLTICFLTGRATAAEPARLLKDINRTPSWEIGSYPADYRTFKDFTLFRASTFTTGTEVWRTDGTTEGTWLVKDIWPGQQSGAISNSFDGDSAFDPAPLGGRALFLADDGVHGWELWGTDGTEAGTAMVKEICPGSAGAFDTIGFHEPRVAWKHAEAGGLVYFAANDGAHGMELWRSDGTEAGTFMLKDINPGSQWALLSVTGFTAVKVGDNLFFSANDGVHGFELWKTNGTPAGTVLVMDILPGPNGSNPISMFDLHGTLLFWAAFGGGNYEPWRSDGTDIGTHMIEELFPGSFGSVPGPIVDLDGVAIFSMFQILFASDGTPNATASIHYFYLSGLTFFGALDHRVLLAAADQAHGQELWSTNGSEPGTALVKDINPGPASSSPSDMIAVGAKRLFMADDGVHGRELWVTDGTENGTQLLFDLTPGADGTLAFLYAAGDRCYLVAFQDGRSRLWSSDGTPAGTRRVEGIEPAGFRGGVAPNGTFLTSASDVAHGTELWGSDGTDAGTAMVKDLNPIVRTDPSYPEFLTTVNVPGAGERLFFSAYEPAHGQELWVSDGTPGGTRLVKDILPGPDGSSPRSAVALGGVLYFAAYGVDGSELWRSDGSEAGTTMVTDVGENPGNGVLAGPVSAGDHLYFIGEDDLHGDELWRSDGTQAGTRLVFETVPGPDSLILGDLASTDSLVFFDTFEPPAFGIALWRSDGTEAGTFAVTDPADGGPNSPRELRGFGNHLFFTARDGAHGFEPWGSDGTVAGTRMLRDIWPGSRNSLQGLYFPLEMGGTIYFAASDGVSGEDLWKTDLTEAGTVKAIDLGPGFASSGIADMVVSGDRLYLSARTTSFTSIEMLKTDGTEEGTVALKSDFESFPTEMVAVNGGAVFNVSDAAHGQEVWSTDGTPAGTRLAQDIVPGALGSRPYDFVKLGSRVLFVADEVASGREPWAARTAILLGKPGQAVGDLRGDVAALGLSDGLTTGLLAKLDSVARALERGRRDEALHALEVFSKHVKTLTPRWIREDAAADLLEFAAETAGLLGSAP